MSAQRLKVEEGVSVTKTGSPHWGRPSKLSLVRLEVEMSVGGGGEMMGPRAKADAQRGGQM